MGGRLAAWQPGKGNHPAASSKEARMERQEINREEMTVKSGDTLTAAHVAVLTRGLGSLRPRLGFECGGPLCICSGDEDCNDLFTTGLCGDAICFEGAGGDVVCLCLRN
jgi:hypothetical protein